MSNSLSKMLICIFFQTFVTSFLNKNVYGLKNCRGFDFITIDDEELIPENLDSINSISEFLRSKLAP